MGTMMTRWMTRIRRLLTTRKCKACGERYRRKLPYCPTCKTLPGHDGIDRGGGDWPGAGPINVGG